MLIVAYPDNGVWLQGWSGQTKMFGSVVAVVFQITFRTEMHINDVFFIF